MYLWEKIKAYWWAILGLLVAVILLITKIFHPKLVEVIPNQLKENREKAEERAALIRAEVKAKTEDQQAELKAISAMEGQERRRRLAEFMMRL